MRNPSSAIKEAKHGNMCIVWEVEVIKISHQCRWKSRRSVAQVPRFQRLGNFFQVTLENSRRQESEHHVLDAGSRHVRDETGNGGSGKFFEDGAVVRARLVHCLDL